MSRNETGAEAVLSVVSVASWSPELTVTCSVHPGTALWNGSCFLLSLRVLPDRQGDFSHTESQP